MADIAAPYLTLFGLDATRLFLGVELALAALLIWALIGLRRKSRKAAREHEALLKAERDLANATAQEAILRAVAQHAKDGLVFQDMRGRILWANPAYCGIMGRELDEIMGRRPQEFCFPPETRPPQEVIDNFRFDPDDITFRELHRLLNIRKNGERFWHEFSQAVVKLQNGENRVILVSRDVTNQVRREQELERARCDLDHAAHHDALTGLFNRGAFLTAADRLLEASRSGGPPIGLMFFDLDQFKAINDSQGHAAGDALLVHVADALREASGPGDVTCRIGGDEFVMACAGVADFDSLHMRADAILDRIREPIVSGNATLSCSASIGLALGGPDTKTTEDLIRSADFALYDAKAPGAPAIKHYDAALHARQEGEKALMQEFVQALDDDAISFAFQPVFDSDLGHIRSFETLARWTRADGSPVPPDRFLGFAARLNRMSDIDFAAIGATASLVAELQQRGHELRGAFNTSAGTLAHPDFLDRLQAEVMRTGLQPEALVAEVLETTFFGPYTTDSLAATRITQLRDRGHPVYLDDFGVGYAGLAHLGQLNVTGIKLDRSLVANVVQSSTARIIVTSILHLCDDLRINSLAEGVESAEQAEFLTAHGCTHLQGFGIARPMPRAALIEMIDSAAPILLPSEHGRLVYHA